MGIEIERKFLLTSDRWRSSITHSEKLVQGYLTRIDSAQPPQACSVRVRVGAASAWLNIKSAASGVKRSEYEYAIPLADAERMLAEFCTGRIEKMRHHVPHAGRLFEIDEFFGDNAGLVVAELELPTVDSRYEAPDWLGLEVSDQRRYYNLNLLHYPYSRWSANERAGEQMC